MYVSRDFTACKDWEMLAPEKANILEVLGIRMARFRITLRCYYCKKDGHFEMANDVGIKDSE